MRGLKLSSVGPRKKYAAKVFFFFFSFITCIQNQKGDALEYILGQSPAMLINRPFKIILNDYDFNQAGVIIIIALFCTACDYCTGCFHTLAMSIDDTSHGVR